MLQVSPTEAAKFNQVWTHNGIAIVMTPIHYKFAADFASVVLKNFIEDAQRKALAAKKAAEEEAKPKIVLAEN